MEEGVATLFLSVPFCHVATSHGGISYCYKPHSSFFPRDPEPIPSAPPPALGIPTARRHRRCDAVTVFVDGGESAWRGARRRGGSGGPIPRPWPVPRGPGASNPGDGSPPTLWGGLESGGTTPEPTRLKGGEGMGTLPPFFGGEGVSLGSSGMTTDPPLGGRGT